MNSLQSKSLRRVGEEKVSSNLLLLHLHETFFLQLEQLADVSPHLDLLSAIFFG
jgi:hypothetical protein